MEIMNQLKPQLWTKNFLVICAVHFLISLIFYILIVTITVYAVREFAATTSQAGLVTGIFIIGALIGRFLVGFIIDVIGRKRTLFIGLVLFTLATLLYFVHSDIKFLLFSRFIHGVAISIASTAAGTIVAQIIPENRKGEGISYFAMSKTLATAIGPAIGLIMSQYTSYQMIFSFCVILGIISVITASFLSVPTLEVSTKKRKPSGLKMYNFIETKVLPIAFITMTIAFSYSSVLSFIDFYTIEINLIKAASFFFIVYSIIVLFSRPFTGHLMDLKGANYVMFPAFISFSVGMLLLSSANSMAILLVAAAFIGLGFGNMQSITHAIAIKLTTPERLGYATSTFFIFMEIGLGFGPYLLGLIIPLIGFRYLYLII